MKRKKYVSLALAFMMLFSTLIFNYSRASALPDASLYSDAVTRVTGLGIMDKTQGTTKQLESYVTREQFAKMLVTALGLGETVSNAQGPTGFGDVSADKAISGYVNLMTSKGLMTGLADGNFHLSDAVNFAQACTSMVKALGYTDADVPGIWPRNYVQKAKDLGISEGIQLSYSDKLPTWAFAVMMNNLLDINMKQANASETAKTFADASGLNNVSYQYGLILNPIYSKPVTVQNYNPRSKKVGNIDLSGNPKIIRNGELATIYDIQDRDVVYQVTDAAKTKKYILVVANQVEGEITDIQPDKIAPKVIQIDNKDYNVSKDMNLSKINSTPGAYKVGDNITALLCYDGNVVDVLPQQSDDNANYACELNYTTTTSKDLKDFGNVTYTVKLLKTDGSTVTYNVEADPSSYKGQLVTFTKVDDDTVSLSPVAGQDTTAEHTFKIDDRMIDSSYLTDHAKIFNIVSNEQGADANVKLVNWTDLPYGKVASGKVTFLNTIGDFGDINVVYLNDIFDEQYKQAVIEKIDYVSSRKGSSYNYTLLIEGKEYVYTATSPLTDESVGDVLKVRLLNGAIDSILEYKHPETEAINVQAIDLKRIKINGNIYRFKDNVSIYFKDYTGTFTAKGVSDVDTTKTYGKVSVYLDKSLDYGGRVETVVISE